MQTIIPPGLLQSKPNNVGASPFLIHLVETAIGKTLAEQWKNGNYPEFTKKGGTIEQWQKANNVLHPNLDHESFNGTITQWLEYQENYIQYLRKQFDRKKQ